MEANSFTAAGKQTHSPAIFSKKNPPPQGEMGSAPEINARALKAWKFSNNFTSITRDITDIHRESVGLLIETPRRKDQTLLKIIKKIAQMPLIDRD